MDQLLVESIVTKIGWLCLVIALDLISGVAIAVQDKKFSLQELPKFMQKYALYALGWLLAEAATIIPPDIYAMANIPIPYEAFTSIGNVGYGFILAGGIGSFMANLANVGLLKAWLEKAGFKK